MTAKPALNLAPFGLWRLRDNAEQRRLLLRWTEEEIAR